ncbi:hypothetical protein AJ79_07427 [Helicocarpus griseus UAMH5409]|uniref:ubiquitinyl hydrolase 1 n=1 Tax=Helicocarpus griseus UAMH5409 TaxID=1447875 RepID=A0A2B7X3A9_9EURO|nr:hypothetical protein AJ79_07427 [Helicocarpus griseus UAMH5409]
MPGPQGSSPHHRLFTTPLKDSYHHELFGEWLPDHSNIVYFGISVLLGYYTLKYLDLIISTLFESAWNILVFLTPWRIVLALDKVPSDQNTELEASTTPLTRRARHTAKSDAMQRILGLDTSSLLTTFPRGRSLSGIGQAFLGLKETCPAGLGNWDNSCYQNSIIQGFASLRSLDRFLEGNMRDLGDRDTFYTHIALKDIIDKLNSPSYGGRKLWTPPELKSMSSWQQQDAQEYFSKVIEQVDKEIRRASKGLTSDAGLRFVDTERNAHKVNPFAPLKGEHVDDHLNSRQGEYTLSFRNPLEGLLAQRVGCMQCGWTEGLSLIPFNCLTVPLGTNWEYDIAECLDEYTALEPIEGVECAKCTLLRTQSQLEQLLEQIGSDTQLEEGTTTPRLTEALRSSAETRLKVVQEALQEEDFSEKTLSEKCHIPARNRVSSTKSRQAVIARAPKSLVIHVNRSVFNEMTGMLRKNYAAVRFPRILDLREWCLGSKSAGEADRVAESWDINPSESMLSRSGASSETPNRRYELRAVVTHYGRHENGHYICYRKYPADSFPAAVSQAIIDADGEKEKTEHWFRLSDEDVSLVSESNVLSQGGVFMLFYECIEESESRTTAAVGEKEAHQQDSPLQDIPCTPQTDESVSQLPASHPSSCSETSDTVSSSSREESPAVAGKIQPAPAMKTASTPFDSNQENHANVGPGPSMVTAL